MEILTLDRYRHSKESPTFRWTKQETELLRLNYTHISHADLAIILGRTENAIRGKCHRLGLRKKASNWTEEELAQLRQHYNQHDPPDFDELEQLFPDRRRTNICRKARELDLTDKCRLMPPDTKARLSVAKKEWHKNNEHPRGFKGHTHTERAKAIIGQKAKEMWEDPSAILNSEEYKQSISDRMSHLWTTRKSRSHYSRGKIGKREDLGGLFVRSTWEANYARYLNWLLEHGEIAGWDYEPDTFWFEAIKRGTRSYTPDFKITNNDGSIEYHEVKGWMDPKSHTKLKRMARYYPHIKIILIDDEAYQAIAEDIRGFIKEWE